MIVVDAHEDLAWNALSFGRDYRRTVAETRKIEAGTETPSRNGNTLLGWDAWVQGRVAVVFATLNAAPIRMRKGLWESQIYADSEGAYSVYSAQLDYYHRLVEESPDKFRLISTKPDLDQVLATWEDDTSSTPQIGLVVLMEGADGVREPAELEDWYRRGVRIVGPAWVGTRYTGGTGEPGPLTNEGIELLEVMSDLGLALDTSHLAEEAFMQALERFQGPIIASHSNTRALLPNHIRPDRHLSDEMIRGIGERDGVIGVVVYNRFLKADWHPSDGREKITRYDVVAHIDHVCQVIGDAQHVGIGTDFDGGLGLEHVPSGFDSIADIRTLDLELQTFGYLEDQIVDVLGGNWLRILNSVLPEG
jgi:membrane dipeptidase